MRGEAVALSSLRGRNQRARRERRPPSQQLLSRGRRANQPRVQQRLYGRDRPRAPREPAALHEQHLLQASLCGKCRICASEEKEPARRRSQPQWQARYGLSSVAAYPGLRVVKLKVELRVGNQRERQRAAVLRQRWRLAAGFYQELFFTNLFSTPSNLNSTPAPLSNVGWVFTTLLFPRTLKNRHGGLEPALRRRPQPPRLGLGDRGFSKLTY